MPGWRQSADRRRFLLRRYEPPRDLIRLGREGNANIDRYNLSRTPARRSLSCYEKALERDLDRMEMQLSEQPLDVSESRRADSIFVQQTSIVQPLKSILKNAGEPFSSCKEPTSSSRVDRDPVVCRGFENDSIGHGNTQQVKNPWTEDNYPGLSAAAVQSVTCSPNDKLEASRRMSIHSPVARSPSYEVSTAREALAAVSESMRTVSAEDEDLSHSQGSADHASAATLENRNSIRTEPEGWRRNTAEPVEVDVNLEHRRSRKRHARSRSRTGRKPHRSHRSETPRNRRHSRRPSIRPSSSSGNRATRKGVSEKRRRSHNRSYFASPELSRFEKTIAERTMLNNRTPMRRQWNAEWGRLDLSHADNENSCRGDVRSEETIHLEIDSSNERRSDATANQLNGREKSKDSRSDSDEASSVVNQHTLARISDHRERETEIEHRGGVVGENEETDKSDSLEVQDKFVLMYGHQGREKHFFKKIFEKIVKDLDMWKERKEECLRRDNEFGLDHCTFNNCIRFRSDVSEDENRDRRGRRRHRHEGNELQQHREQSEQTTAMAEETNNNAEADVLTGVVCNAEERMQRKADAQQLLLNQAERAMRNEEASRRVHTKDVATSPSRILENTSAEANDSNGHILNGNSTDDQCSAQATSGCTSGITVLWDPRRVPQRAHIESQTANNVAAIEHTASVGSAPPGITSISAYNREKSVTCAAALPTEGQAASTEAPIPVDEWLRAQQTNGSEVSLHEENENTGGVLEQCHSSASRPVNISDISSVMANPLYHPTDLAEELDSSASIIQKRTCHLRNHEEVDVHARCSCLSKLGICDKCQNIMHQCAQRSEMDATKGPGSAVDADSTDNSVNGNSEPLNMPAPASDERSDDSARPSEPEKLAAPAVPAQGARDEEQRRATPIVSRIIPPTVHPQANLSALLVPSSNESFTRIDQSYMNSAMQGLLQPGTVTAHLQNILQRQTPVDMRSLETIYPVPPTATPQPLMPWFPTIPPVICSTSRENVQPMSYQSQIARQHDYVGFQWEVEQTIAQASLLHPYALYVRQPTQFARNDRSLHDGLAYWMDNPFQH